MMKMLLVFLMVVVATLAAAQATEAESPNSTSKTAEPFSICHPKQPASADKCLYNCNDTSRPAQGSCIVLPKATFTPDPEYSEQARRLHIQGNVSLDVTVSAKGDVVDVKVVRGLEPGLDQSSIDAVSHWQFDPATLDGKAVAVKLNVRTSFRMYSGPPHSPPSPVMRKP